MSIYNIARNIVEASRKKSSKYKKFKQAVLAYYGVNSPEELSPDKKKQFYKYIDKEWKRFKSSMDANVNNSNTITESNFSKIDATYINIVDDDNSDVDKIELDELVGDENPENKHLYKHKTGSDVSNWIKDLDSSDTKGDIKKQKQMGYTHSKTIEAISIKRENGVEYDLEELKSLIKVRPKKLLMTNEKMSHGSIGTVKFFNIGLPALKSLVVDESKNEFVLVQTCPGAGSCIFDCYALKGSYIMFKNVGLSRARKLNFLINDPIGYKDRILHELKNKVKNLGKKNITPIIRWHDAGDFFAKEYLDIAISIAKEYPEITFYAYTKRASAANANVPDNLLIRFSTGAAGAEEKIIDTSKSHLAHIVDFELFKDLFVLGKNGRPSKISKTDTHWQYISPEEDSIRELKRRVGEKWKLDPETVLTHDEFMNDKERHSGESKWNVIIRPGDSDYPAKVKSVKAVYNLQH